MTEEQKPTGQEQVGQQSQVDNKAAEEITQSVAEPSPQAGDANINAELERARREAAKYRTQLRSVEQKLAEYEQAKLTDQEKLAKRAEEAEKRAAELEQRYRETVIENQIIAAAQRANVIDVEAVARLIDRSQLTVDENGRAVNVEEAVKALLKQKPYLLAASGGQASNPSRSDAVELENPILAHMQHGRFDPFDPAVFRRPKPGR